MSRIKEFYIKYLSWINAYWLVTIVFLIVTFTVGDSSLYKRYTYDEKIRGLEKEIKHYQKEIEINSKKLNDLHTDKEGLERFAREGLGLSSPPAPPFQRIRRTSNDRIFRLYVQQPYRVDPLLERSRYLTDIYRFRYS